MALGLRKNKTKDAEQVCESDGRYSEMSVVVVVVVLYCCCFWTIETRRFEYAQAPE
jgi:hypothetical protein